jgi:hypothetical protein
MKRATAAMFTLGYMVALGCGSDTSPADTDPRGCGCFNGAQPTCASRIHAYEATNNCKVAAATGDDRDLYRCTSGVWSEVYECM